MQQREPFCCGPLLAIGVFSLLLWYWTDDLRGYIWVQFFPCLVLPLLLLMFPPKYTRHILLVHSCSALRICQVA